MSGEHLGTGRAKILGSGGAVQMIAQHAMRFRYLSDEKVWTVCADGVWWQDRHLNQMMLFAEDVRAVC